MSAGHMSIITCDAADCPARWPLDTSSPNRYDHTGARHFAALEGWDSRREPPMYVRDLPPVLRDYCPAHSGKDMPPPKKPRYKERAP